MHHSLLKGPGIESLLPFILKSTLIFTPGLPPFEEPILEGRPALIFPAFPRNQTGVTAPNKKNKKSWRPHVRTSRTLMNPLLRNPIGRVLFTDPAIIANFLSTKDVAHNSHVQESWGEEGGQQWPRDQTKTLFVWLCLNLLCSNTIGQKRGKIRSRSSWCCYVWWQERTVRAHTHTHTHTHTHRGLRDIVTQEPDMATWAESELQPQGSLVMHRSHSLLS